MHDSFQDQTFRLEVIVQHQRQQVANSPLSVFFYFALQLQDGLEVHVYLHEDLPQVGCLIRFEANPATVDIFSVTLGLADL